MNNSFNHNMTGRRFSTWRYLLPRKSPDRAVYHERIGTSNASVWQTNHPKIMQISLYHIGAKGRQERNVYCLPGAELLGLDVLGDSRNRDFLYTFD
jgi:hypothetical protein